VAGPRAWPVAPLLRLPAAPAVAQPHFRGGACSTAEADFRARGAPWLPFCGRLMCWLACTVLAVRPALVGVDELMRSLLDVCLVTRA
jgi:hypothetical protein